MTLQRGDVVLVPFPFTDLTLQKARPAVVISPERFNASSADVVLVAIRSRLPASPNDTDLILRHGSTGFQATGLRVSSVIRTTKLVTLQQSLIYTTLGKLDSRLIDELDSHLARAVGLQTLGDEITARRAAEAQVETLTARVNDLEERLAKCSSGKSCGDETKRRISWKMVCANKPITRRYIVAKKHSTKRKEAQAKLRKLRRQQVNYFEVPKPLWKRIKHIFPRQKRRKGRGRPPLPNRLVFNAIWYVLWTGCQWKALPHRQFGVSSSAAHERFQLWQEMGIFTEIMKEMVRFYDKQRKIRWKWQAADGKNCPAPLGGEDTGPNPTDRSKCGSKIHLLVDRRGAPLAVYVSSANRHDKCSLQDLVCSMVVDRPDSEQHLCLDRGYDYSDIWEFLNLEHYVSHIKHRRRRGEPEPDPCPIPGEARHLARRWVVERTFSWLAKRRSIRTRWCKKVVNWLALLQFACAHVTFNMAFSG